MGFLSTTNIGFINQHVTQSVLLRKTEEKKFQNGWLRATIIKFKRNEIELMCSKYFHFDGITFYMAYRCIIVI